MTTMGVLSQYRELRASFSEQGFVGTWGLFSTCWFTAFFWCHVWLRFFGRNEEFLRELLLLLGLSFDNLA